MNAIVSAISELVENVQSVWVINQPQKTINVIHKLNNTHAHLKYCTISPPKYASFLQDVCDLREVSSFYSNSSAESYFMEFCTSRYNKARNRCLC